MSSSPSLSSDRLALLCRLSQDFNSSLDVNEVLNRVMDEVISVIHAERGILLLAESPDAPWQDGQVVVVSPLKLCRARGLDSHTIASKDFRISHSILEQVACEGKAVLTSDAQNDDRFSARQSVIQLRLRSILCVPIKIKERLLGIIYVDNRIQAGIFTPADLELLTAIAANAAIAIENAHLYQVAIEKGRMERELQVASRVQSALIPHQTPKHANWDFAARWLPARHVGGDYYDFVPLEIMPGSHPTTGLVIADVTDKGMPAALFMTLTRSTLRASLYSATSPAEGIRRANKLVCADSPNSMFVTMFYAQLDLESGEMIYVNAGHNPPMLFKTGSNPQTPYTLLRRTGLPLGVEPESEYTQEKVYLAPGDFVFFYTDGVLDALNAQGKEFGMESMIQILLQASSSTANDMVETLEQALGNFIGSTPPYDDITILVAKHR